MTRSHSTPNVDPTGGDPASAERCIIWLCAAMTAVVVIALTVAYL